jgi:hypothetical protein
MVSNVTEIKVQLLSIELGNQLKVFHCLLWSTGGNEIAR